MKVTGFKLREALRRWTHRSQIAHQLFQQSLVQFTGEDKNPFRLSERITQADRGVALLETLQQAYNQLVTVKVLEEQMSLALAIKLVSAAVRHESEWRATTIPGATCSATWAVDSTKQPHEPGYATPTFETEAALLQADISARWAAALRAAIAAGNSTEIDLATDIEPHWLD